MGIMSKVQHWFKVMFEYKHVGDLSQHRLYSDRYEDLCK